MEGKAENPDAGVVKGVARESRLSNRKTELYRRQVKWNHNMLQLWH
jgi:hypothetical protein